jgi:hypothetical protein
MQIRINPFARGQQQARRPPGRRAYPEQLRAVAEAARVPTVSVLPANEILRRKLKHPNGMGFRNEGPIRWPLDKFTQRRIADGSVTVVEEPRPEEPKHEEGRARSRSSRESAA